MKDKIELGSTPYGEDCAQVGRDGYAELARKECNAYRNQLVRLHGKPPEGASLIVKSFPHDFGSYYEVCVSFDDEDEVQSEYAYKLEGNCPELWDKEAKEELRLVEVVS